MTERTLLAELFSLTDRCAVVTGATGYLGRAFAEALLSAGARVALFGRRAATDVLRTELAAQYGADHVMAVVVDCADDERFRTELAAVDDRLGGIDILVNNAFEFSKATGFNDPSGQFSEIARDQWLRGLEAGIYWHASATQVIAERMKRRGRGSIINISSMYGRVAPDPALYYGRNTFNPPTYSVAKTALLGLTRYTASFYGPYGVRCNALLPGAFPNPDTSAYNAPADGEFLELLAQRTVLGRVGQPRDLQGALLFLASDASAYVTGQELVVDGGWTVR